ncbi:MAG: patatin-like phospholipase family protein [Anaerolineae bacterium]|nr:patatin-like phospholipase family protein [Anaerolineae bacterium]
MSQVQRQVTRHTARRKKLGLALGGGGVRGLAHVGVIRALEREGIAIDCIAGSSVGSLVGAAYAAGFRGDRLVDLALSTHWRDLATFVWPDNGFVSFERMEHALAERFGDRSFSELDIPYAAIAADLATGEQVTLREGKLAAAVRASCSVPGIVTPVEIGGRVLVDGGAVNNLPISVVRELGADVVLAVALGDPSAGPPQGTFQVALRAIEFLLYHASDDPASADLYLAIPLTGFSSLVRTSAGRRIMALGEEMAQVALPDIKAALR